MGVLDQSAPAGVAASAAEPQGVPHLLEHSHNVVESTRRKFEVVKCGCNCWFCPDCCELKGYKLRARLIPILETFRGLIMLTLTVDPELFASPMQAYLYVRSKRAISSLMKELCRKGHLHSRRYFYVVEFQKQTEQAHFHVLIDATRVPKQAIDLAWSRFRPKSAGPVPPNRPAFGLTRFSKPRFDGGAVHAARYATKYLVKTPDQGWPAWVLAMGAERRVHRYQTSRGFWNTPRTPAACTRGERKREGRSYSDRLKHCGSASDIFELTETVDFASGEVIPARQWKGRIGLHASDLGVIAPSQRRGRPRVAFNAPSPADFIRALEFLSGQSLPILAGPLAGRSTR